MATVLPDAPANAIAAGPPELYEPWINRATEIFKVILPQLDPGHTVAVEIAELLAATGIDPAETTEEDDEEPEQAGDSMIDRFANVLEILRMIVPHANPPGEVANALTDLIDTYSMELPAETIAGARTAAASLEAAGWPS